MLIQAPYPPRPLLQLALCRDIANDDSSKSLLMPRGAILKRIDRPVVSLAEAAHRSIGIDADDERRPEATGAIEDTASGRAAMVGAHGHRGGDHPAVAAAG